jgi:hypothetical protein
MSIGVYLQTHPADMGVTDTAFDMIAAFNLINERCTLRTRLGTGHGCIVGQWLSLAVIVRLCIVFGARPTDVWLSVAECARLC